MTSLQYIYNGREIASMLTRIVPRVGEYVELLDPKYPDRHTYEVLSVRHQPARRNVAVRIKYVGMA